MKLHQSRRKFLHTIAKSGLLIPFASHLGIRVAGAAGAANRVVFMYYPNGMHVPAWNPSQGNGTISNGGELSFSLAPLSNWHDKMIVCKDLYLSGVPGGGHEESMLNVFGGKANLGSNEATIDRILADRMGVDHLFLGVRTANDASKVLSKPFNVANNQRPISNNDPKDAADKIFRNVSNEPGNNEDAQRIQLRNSMIDALLEEFDTLSDISLSAENQNKISQHASALTSLKSSANVIVSGDCVVTKTTVSDPYKDGSGSTEDKSNLIPAIARAQIDNIVAAFSCGVTSVAMLQLFRGDENGNFANYSFDECWNHIQQASQFGNVPNRWWNEHTSHTASHKEFASHAGQARWYAELLAYMLQQLQNQSILDDTLVVMMSEVGDGNNHGPNNGGVIVAGGAGGALQMGRIIDCGNSRSSSQLFVDIGNLVGHNLTGYNGWGGGGVLS